MSTQFDVIWTRSIMRGPAMIAYAETTEVTRLTAVSAEAARQIVERYADCAEVLEVGCVEEFD